MDFSKLQNCIIDTIDRVFLAVLDFVHDVIAQVDSQITEDDNIVVTEDIKDDVC